MPFQYVKLKAPKHKCKLYYCYQKGHPHKTQENAQLMVSHHIKHGGGAELGIRDAELRQHFLKTQPQHLNTVIFCSKESLRESIVPYTFLSILEKCASSQLNGAAQITKKDLLDCKIRTADLEFWWAQRKRQVSLGCGGKVLSYSQYCYHPHWAELRLHGCVLREVEQLFQYISNDTYFHEPFQNLIKTIKIL